MVAASLADGHLSPEEKALIDKNLAESNLNENQQAQVRQDMVLPPSVTELSVEAADATVRETAYRFAALVLLADQEVSHLERRWLDRLADAYDLGERKAAIESEIFPSSD